jgi:hypothetical protein
MKTTFKVNVAAILILGVAVAFFFWYGGRKNREIDLHLNTIAQHEFKWEERESEIDSATIVYQQTLNASNEALKAALADDSIQAELLDYYKNLSQVVVYETEYIHDTVKVSVPIYIEKDTTVNLSDDCFKASLSLSTGSVSLDNYTIANRQDIVIGSQKRRFGRGESYIAIRNTNPCINTTGVQSYTVVYEKKWWENPLITVPASVAVGYAAGRMTK